MHSDSLSLLIYTEKREERVSNVPMLYVECVHRVTHNYSTTISKYIIVPNNFMGRYIQRLLAFQVCDSPHTV